MPLLRRRCRSRRFIGVGWFFLSRWCFGLHRRFGCDGLSCRRRFCKGRGRNENGKKKEEPGEQMERTRPRCRSRKSARCLYGMNVIEHGKTFYHRWKRINRKYRVKTGPGKRKKEPRFCALARIVLLVYFPPRPLSACETRRELLRSLLEAYCPRSVVKVLWCSSSSARICSNRSRVVESPSDSASLMITL